MFVLHYLPTDKCYLDHAGTALYGESQLRAVQELLAGGLYCNPHTSRTMEDLIDLVRYRVLRCHWTTDDRMGEPVETWPVSQCTLTLAKQDAIALIFRFADAINTVFVIGCNRAGA